ncbi:hypothetical protein MTO96_049204 [Rhipicephalus appendiculatus]
MRFTKEHKGRLLPAAYRVNLPLRHLAEFAHVFGCSADSADTVRFLLGRCSSCAVVLRDSWNVDGHRRWAEPLTCSGTASPGRRRHTFQRRPQCGTEDLISRRLRQSFADMVSRFHFDPLNSQPDF